MCLKIDLLIIIKDFEQKSHNNNNNNNNNNKLAYNNFDYNFYVDYFYSLSRFKEVCEDPLMDLRDFIVKSLGRVKAESNEKVRNQLFLN